MKALCLLIMGVAFFTLSEFGIQNASARDSFNKCRPGANCSRGRGRVKQPRNNRARDIRKPRDIRTPRDVRKPRDVRRPNQPRVRKQYNRSNWNVEWATKRHRRHRHRPLWWMDTYSYTYYSHVPYRNNYNNHHRSWVRPMNYHYTLAYKHVYWNRWVRVRHQSNNGFYTYDNYPYFIYNGYRHRYSSIDSCDYELVDGFNNFTERTYYSYSCSMGYDMCAEQRDRMNSYENNYRYFCSEKFEKDQNFNYNWDYSDDYWSDTNTEDDDYYEDDFYDDDNSWENDWN